jgi:hypothetical protein
MPVIFRSEHCRNWLTYSHLIITTLIEWLSSELRCPPESEWLSGGMAGPTESEMRWSEFRASFEKDHDALLTAHPDAQQEIALIRTALKKICELVRKSPCSNGEGPVWKHLTDKAEDDREVMSSCLDGKALFTGVLWLYAAVHTEMHETIQHDETASKDEFREQRRLQRNPSDEKTQVKHMLIWSRN